MESTDQLLEKEGEKMVKMRVSREGGLEHLVRELHLGNRFVLTFPARVSLDADAGELTFEIAMNIGVEPHPGLHFGASFDVPIKVPERPKEVEEAPVIEPASAPPPSARDRLRAEIVSAGGKPEDIGVDQMTEAKAKEVLDALSAPGSAAP